MRKALVAPLVIALLSVSAVALLGCEDEDTGIPCKAQTVTSTTPTPSNSNEQEPQFTTNALDCRSRLCLQVGGDKDAKALCTKLCESDDDCPDKTDACDSGFSCTYIVQTTALHCCKMCVCKRYLSSSATASSYCESHPNSDCPKL